MFARLAIITAGLLVVILCLSCAGCVHHNTLAQRNASFSVYEDAKLGPESVRQYLIRRSGILCDAESFDTTSLSTNSFRFNAKKAAYGTVTAIDQRGYFLTAAHCVENSQIWVAFLRDDKLQMERARIVWRGAEKKGEPDLALLCVSRPLTQTFEWAAEFTNGSPVVDLGLRVDEHPLALKPQCVAGWVLKASERSSKDSLDYTVVCHSSPLRRGDSGGPLVLSDGRLLGINIGWRADFQWSHLSFERVHGEAHRPDLAWLRKVIDADAALFSREASSP